MSRQLKVWPMIRRVWITVGLGATAIFVTWSLIAYRADPTATQATIDDASVTVTHSEGVWRFEPRTGASARTLVFFPGALVDPRAYAPLARAVAKEGFSVVMVELPRRGAFGGADSPELRTRVNRTLSTLTDSGSVILGGHSRGGVVASATAAGGVPNLSGLVLIGTSHPRDVDLSGLRIPVTKIVGTRDGLASPPEVRRNEALLPEHTRWIWIEGGNHSQFGWYGFQPMDRPATLPAAEQRHIMIEGVLGLMRAAPCGIGQEGIRMNIKRLAVSLVVLWACASSEDVPPEGRLGPGTKTVTSKVDPSTLVALDGTICNVMPMKFEDTMVGDEVWCDWRSRSEGPNRGSGV